MLSDTPVVGQGKEMRTGIKQEQHSGLTRFMLTLELNV